MASLFDFSIVGSVEQMTSRVLAHCYSCPQCSQNDFGIISNSQPGTKMFRVYGNDYAIWHSADVIPAKNDDVRAITALIGGHP